MEPPASVQGYLFCTKQLKSAAWKVTLARLTPLSPLPLSRVS